MSVDFKDVMILLYDRFGDDFVDMVRDTPNKENTASEEEVVNRVEKPQHNSTEYEDKQVDYCNADVFEKKTLSGMQQGIAVVMNSGDVAAAVKDLILMAGEVRKFEEAQITVRTDIAAGRDVALANIEVQKAALMMYLDKSFDERKENFHALFSLVDDALEKNNMQQLAMSLESIIKLAESSPFKDLETIEATAAALTDPDHKWDF